jgi:putative Mg2+ transporter-C (MgtC) family protein
MAHDAELLLRVLIAGLLSGALGWERESAGKSAGLRTHVLVGMAACIFVVAGEAAALSYPAMPGAIRIEPFAIIQAVAVGIGFLGSGIVFISQAESRVHGLTTAASVWATAAMGLTVGFGRFFLAVGVTALLLITLRGLRRFDHTRHQE